jgi:hypothetical protein
VADGRLTGADEDGVAAEGHRVARRIAHATGGAGTDLGSVVMGGSA